MPEARSQIPCWCVDPCPACPALCSIHSFLHDGPFPLLCGLLSKMGIWTRHSDSFKNRPSSIPPPPSTSSSRKRCSIPPSSPRPIPIFISNSFEAKKMHSCSLSREECSC
jgi:hypothetical protein